VDEDQLDQDKAYTGGRQPGIEPDMLEAKQQEAIVIKQFTQLGLPETHRAHRIIMDTTGKVFIQRKTGQQVLVKNLEGFHGIERLNNLTALKTWQQHHQIQVKGLVNGQTGEVDYKLIALGRCLGGMLPVATNMPEKRSKK